MDFNSLFNDTFHEALRTRQGPFWFTDKFCHYTNLHGMVGIIESQQLWLSDHRFLNDTKEISYGRELAIRKISAAAASESDKDFSLFLKSIAEQIRRPRKHASYICSMSLAIDVLDQWKWYGSSTDGVCMVFSGEQSLWNDGNSHPTHIRQRRIVYSEQEQIAIIENLINIFKSKFNEFRDFQTPFIPDLTWLIEEEFIGFKDSQYESEQEIRITIENLTQIIKDRGIMHRVAKDLVIPYITTGFISKTPNFRPNTIPLVEIIVGPRAKADSASSIEAFLANKGLDSIPVSFSKVQFRG